MPWVKLDHDHPEVLVIMPPSCGICGRAVDETQYHCAEDYCPYPYPPAPVEEVPVVEPIEPPAPAATAEPLPDQPPADVQPPVDVAPAPGQPQPT
jgi:hypothetical protein